MNWILEYNAIECRHLINTYIASKLVNPLTSRSCLASSSPLSSLKHELWLSPWPRGRDWYCERQYSTHFRHCVYLGSSGWHVASIRAWYAHRPNSGSTSSQEILACGHAFLIDWQTCSCTFCAVISSPVPSGTSRRSKQVTTMMRRLFSNMPANRNRMK